MTVLSLILAYLPTALIIAALGVVVFLAIRSVIRSRRRGGCGCGCEGCTMACARHEQEDPS